MARRNKAVTRVVAWRRKREIKECPEFLLRNDGGVNSGL
jgi:hypothetical protein